MQVYSNAFFYACNHDFLPWLWAFCMQLNTGEKGDIVGFTYKQQYAVVVMCKDEKEQETIYNRLKEEGFKLKVVAV